MAIAFDAVGPAGGGGSYTPNVSGSGGTGTWSHICTGSDLVLVAAMTLSREASGDVSGISATVTYNGVAMTPFGAILAAGSNTAWLRGWYLEDPAVGTHDVVVTLAGTAVQVRFLAGSISWSGAGTVENYTVQDPATTATNSPTCTVASATDRQVFVAANHGADITAAAGGTTLRTLRNNSGTSSGDNFAMGSAVGAASVGLGFTSAADDHWALLGASITAAGGVDWPVSPVDNLGLTDTAAAGLPEYQIRYDYQIKAD
jgi:hypothetical protein